MQLPLLSTQSDLPKGEIAAAILISVLAGVIASTGNYLYVVVLIASVIAISIAISSVTLLWAMIVTGIVFAGLFRTYLPQFEYIRWAVLPGSMALLFHVLFSSLSSRNRISNSKIPTTLWWVIAFMVIAVLSSVINNIDSSSYLAAYKGYFQAWGILFALAFLSYNRKSIEIIPKAFLVFAFVQLPFVLQQYFILAPSRVGMAKGTVAIDVVSGTFGISAHGGNNALLSAFLYICIAGCIALWQEKVWSAKKAFLVSILLFWPTMMNEAKIGLFFLLAIFSILFFRYALSNISRFLLTIAALVISISVLLWAFTIHVHENDNISNPIDLLQYTYEYNIDSDEGWNGELSKFGTIKYWFGKHGSENIRETLIGHGAGISRQRMEQKYVFNITSGPDASIGIGKTAFSAVLWEFGILGLICVLGIFLSGFISAVKSADTYAQDKYKRAIFRASSVAIAILFLSFMSKSYFVYQVAYQTIFVTILGYLMYWERRATTSSAENRDEYQKQ